MKQLPLPHTISPAYRVLATIPLILAIGVALLIGMGFIFSIFFDSKMHSMVALVALPGLMVSLIYGSFILFALNHDLTCRRLLLIGIITTAIVLLSCLCLLILQSLDA